MVKGGAVSDEILFVSEGYFQSYILNDIEEKTVHIVGDIDFIGAMASFISRQPSNEYIQAVTKANTLVINYNDLQTLYGQSKSWERLGRNVMENMFVREQGIVISFIKHSAELRYENLMKNRPGLIQNVPLRIIASYLGVKPETLSRIRAKIS